jgi:hypothetical protein
MYFWPEPEGGEGIEGLLDEASELVFFLFIISSYYFSSSLIWQRQRELK